MKKLFIILLLFCSALIHAQQLKVSANKNPAFIGEQVLIKYSINVEAKDFKSPSFNGLKILSGPNPSMERRSSNINGKVQNNTSITYSYYIQAAKEGTYTISPATIMVNGNAIKSKAYTLIVEKGDKQNTTKQNKKTTFITVTASKKSVFIGEPFSVIYSLHIEEGTRFQVSKIFPLTFNNFSEEIIPQGEPKKDIVNGIRYDVYKYRHSILIPQTSGKETISPSQIDLNIISNGKLLYHDIFRGAVYDQKITPRSLFSKSFTIDVKKLPLKKPKHFYNLVGKNYSIKSKIYTDSIKSTVDTLTTKRGEVINYEVIIRGDGNINQAEVFPVEFPKEFTVIKDDITDKTFPTNKTISGSKIFKYTLIPRIKGLYIIPPFTYRYFDVKKEEYILLQTEEYKINVLASDLNDSIVSPKEGGVELQTEANLTKIEDRERYNKYYLIFFYSIMTLITLLVLYYLYTINKIIDPTNEKRRKSTKIAIKRLKNARFYLKNDNFDQFFEEIEKSLWGYFADKFEVNSSELSKETIDLYFDKRNIKTETKNNFVSLLNICEFARYSPSKDRNLQMERTLEEAKEIIIEVESDIKKK